ncbi:MAG: hypothetical protein GY769_00905, partial [bacterium]|nr:hypothetical protein [bacterium]
MGTKKVKEEDARAAQGSTRGSCGSAEWQRVGDQEGPPGRQHDPQRLDKWYGNPTPAATEHDAAMGDGGGDGPRQHAYPEPPEAGYTCVGPHEQWWTPAKHVKYKMFSAAGDGCLYCVQQQVQRYGQDLFAVSDNMQYNVLDYAVEARQTENKATVPLEAWLLQQGLQL